MQMLFTAMLIDALHAAFEDTEIAFDGVAVDRAVGEIDILARAVRRGAVTSEMQLHVAIAAMFVRHHASFAGDVSGDDRHKRLGADIVDYHRAGLAAVTIAQSQHLHLVMERALQIGRAPGREGVWS